MELKIFKAAPDDLDWILGELKKFSEFLEMKRNVYGDEQFSRQALLNFMESQILFIAKNDSVRAGFIGGFLTAHLFNPSVKVLCEVFWWVAEEHRRSRAGAMLLNAFMEFGEKNADMITFALESKSPVNENTLFKRGFVLQEKNYIKEII